MRYYAASAGAGFLQALCFLPLGLDFLAWIAIVPLFLALAREQRPLAAITHGVVFGAAFFVLDISWVYQTLRIHGHFTVLPALLAFLSLAAVLAVFPTIFAYLCHFFSYERLCHFKRRSIFVGRLGICARANFYWFSMGFARILPGSQTTLDSIYGFNGHLWGIFFNFTD